MECVNRERREKRQIILRMGEKATWNHITLFYIIHNIIYNIACTYNLQLYTHIYEIMLFGLTM